MPYLRRRRSYARRRPTLRTRRSRKTRPSYRRRRTFRASRRNSIVVPKSFSNKMKYMDYFSFGSGGAASFQQRIFRLNSCRDPVEDLGGGSCTGFAELTALWKRYQVMGSRIRIWTYNTCASPIIIGVLAASSDYIVPGSGSLIQQTLFERPDICRSRTLTPYTGTGMAHPHASFSYYRTVKSLEGRLYTEDQDYVSTSTTEPNNQLYWYVYACALDGTSVSITANVRIEITYYVRWLQTDIPTTD